LAKKDIDCFKIALEGKDGFLHLVEFPYTNGTRNITTIDNFLAKKVKIADNGKGLIAIETKGASVYSFGFGSNPSLGFDGRSFDNFIKFYKIVKVIKNETYE
jgi:hypothetical protein